MTVFKNVEMPVRNRERVCLSREIDWYSVAIAEMPPVRDNG